MISFFTTTGALDSSNQGQWNKTRKIPMSVIISLKGCCLYSLYLTYWALGASHCLLLYSSRVLLASFFLFLDMGLPSVDGIFWLRCCICTMVPKSWVCMTNNYSRGGGFLVLLLPWPLALLILSSTIRKRKARRGERIACNSSKTRMDREITKLRFYYI
jgi:hypothetical protein